jgi:hypothetical protein
VVNASRHDVIRELVGAALAAIGDGGLPWDEDRWEQFVKILDQCGRLALGYPQLYDDTSSIFGALDDIAGEIEKSTKTLRGVAEVITEALEPDDGQVSTPAARPESDQTEVGNPVPRAPSMLEPVAEPPEPQPIIEEPSGRVNLLEPEVAAAIDSHARARQGPRYDRDAMFSVIRSTPSLAAAARELGLGSSTVLYSRLDTLQGRGELPADIAAKRPSVNGAMVVPRTLDRAERRVLDAQEAERQRVREVADDIRAREAAMVAKNVAELDDFMARRKKNAGARADAAWESRTGERPA